MNQETATSAGVSEALADGKLLLTVEEAAQRLGIGRTVMYRPPRVVRNGRIRDARPASAGTSRMPK